MPGRLAGASALVVGIGGLGSASSYYLALAGIGKLGLVDGDTVDLSNLQRQVLHATPDLGTPKVESAARKLRCFFPHLDLELYPVRLTPTNALSILSGYDIIVDACDNFATRYLLNDACYLLGKPFSYGAVFRYEGQASLFFPGEGPCLRCLFPSPPEPGTVPTCVEAGILGPVAGLVGCIQAADVTRYLRREGETYRGRLWLYDARSSSWDEVRLSRDPECPVCGDGPRLTGMAGDYGSF
ncbi:MAG TPA: HesA/MoeB/ThiF family protein [Firmicutes bacterium]|nr:HesA/MoeB/ThiF family protein [Bacillota bacterium]